MSPVEPDRGEADSNEPPLVTLAFHKLTPKITFGSTNYSPRRFERLLSFLAASGCEFDSGHGETSLQISFDDGYQHLREALPPLMERFNLRPIVFIPTDWIGRMNRWDYSSRLAPDPHLNEQSIRELAELGARFGSHGKSHCDLTALDPSKLSAELFDSRKRLQDLTGQAVEGVSYPFGRVNAQVREAAAEAGYTRGYTMEFPTPEDIPLATGRIGVYCYDTNLTVFHKVTGARLYLLERLKARITNRLSGGTVLLNRLRGYR